MPKIRKVIMNCQDWERDKNNFKKVSNFNIDTGDQKKDGGQAEMILAAVSLGIFALGAFGFAFLFMKQSKAGQGKI